MHIYIHYIHLLNFINLVISDGFTMQGDNRKGLFILMNVSHTRISFSGPVVFSKHRVAAEFGCGIFKSTKVEVQEGERNIGRRGKERDAE